LLKKTIKARPKPEERTRMNDYHVPAGKAASLVNNTPLWFASGIAPLPIQ